MSCWKRATSVVVRILFVVRKECLNYISVFLGGKALEKHLKDFSVLTKMVRRRNLFHVKTKSKSYFSSSHHPYPSLWLVFSLSLSAT